MANLMEKAKNFVSEKVVEMKKPEASVMDVDLKDISRDAVTYNAKISVQNPYSHSVPICQISYTLKSAGRKSESDGGRKQRRRKKEEGKKKKEEKADADARPELDDRRSSTIGRSCDDRRSSLIGDLRRWRSCDDRPIGRNAGPMVIASGTVPDPGSLMAKDTTILDVGLKVAHSVLVTLGKDIGADWDIDYELDLGLTLDLPLIGNFTIPLSSKGEIKLPTLSDLWNK